MKIYYLNPDEPIFDIPVDDNSYRYRSIMGENELTLYFSYPGHIEIPVNSYCDFEGERYFLIVPENFKKNSPRDFGYILILDSEQYVLSQYKFRDLVSNRLKFSYTGTPQQHLQLLIDNLNAREEGWVLGSCLGATEKAISYNHNYFNEALQMIAQAFETEWEISGKTINLGKIEYGLDNPLPLSYGRGNGFRPGVGRSVVGKNRPISTLYVQGGERNIDKSTYGSSELLLPRNQILEYNGRIYISDANGLYIKRMGDPHALVTGIEGSVDLSNIYPSRIGEVSGVEAIDAQTNLYDFLDASIPEALNFEDCLIEGQTMTVIFQSGMLAGKEFDVKYIHSERRFQIVPTELDGQKMPNDIYSPSIGNKYAVFGISLPPAYICNDETQTGASWDMFREAAKYLYENEDQRFSFTGELDPIYAKTNWEEIGSKIRLGGTVLFSDNQFLPDGALIRITGVKDFVNSPHSPVIELSNMPIQKSIREEIRKISTNEVATDTNLKSASMYVDRKHNIIIDIQDDKFKADPLVRTVDLTPRMLDYDAGTPQFSIKGGEVSTNVEGLPNRIKIEAGEFINHSFFALNKEEIKALKDAGLPYDPTRKWDILETVIDLENDLEHFMYIKVPIDKDPIP